MREMSHKNVKYFRVFVLIAAAIWIFTKFQTLIRLPCINLLHIRIKRLLSSTDDSVLGDDHLEHELFAGISALDPEIGTAAIVIIIAFVYLLKQLFELLHKITHDTNFYNMIHQIEEELMIVGGSSFIFKVLINTTELSTTPWFFPLEWAEILVPFLAFTYCMIGAILVVISIRQSSLWNRAHNLKLNEIIAEFDKDSRSFWFRFSWKPLYNSINQMEFRILNNLFCTTFQIHKTIALFDEYVCKVLQSYIYDLIEIRLLDWIYVCCILAGNLIRVNLKLELYHCAEHDNDCIQLRTLKLYTITGAGIFALTCLLLFHTRNLKKKIFYKQGLLSYQDYPEYLRIIESIMIDSADMISNKSGLKDATISAIAEIKRSKQSNNIDNNDIKKKLEEFGTKFKQKNELRRGSDKHIIREAMSQGAFEAMRNKSNNFSNQDSIKEETSDNESIESSKNPYNNAIQTINTTTINNKTNSTINNNLSLKSTSKLTTKEQSFIDSIQDISFHQTRTISNNNSNHTNKTNYNNYNNNYNNYNNNYNNSNNNNDNNNNSNNNKINNTNHTNNSNYNNIYNTIANNDSNNINSNATSSKLKIAVHTVISAISDMKNENNNSTKVNSFDEYDNNNLVNNIHNSDVINHIDRNSISNNNIHNNNKIYNSNYNNNSKQYNISNNVESNNKNINMREIDLINISPISAKSLDQEISSKNINSKQLIHVNNNDNLHNNMHNNHNNNIDNNNNDDDDCDSIGMPMRHLSNDSLDVLLNSGTFMDTNFIDIVRKEYQTNNYFIDNNVMDNDDISVNKLVNDFQNDSITIYTKEFEDKTSTSFQTNKNNNSNSNINNDNISSNNIISKSNNTVNMTILENDDHKSDGDDSDSAQSNTDGCNEVLFNINDRTTTNSDINNSNGSNSSNNNNNNINTSNSSNNNNNINTSNSSNNNNNINTSNSNNIIASSSTDKQSLKGFSNTKIYPINSNYTTTTTTTTSMLNELPSPKPFLTKKKSSLFKKQSSQFFHNTNKQISTFYRKLSKESKDVIDVFFLNRPYLYFESVQLILMIISFYIALWFSNMAASAKTHFWTFIPILPGILSCYVFLYIVPIGALLKAIYKVDHDLLLEAIEENEEVIKLKCELRDKVMEKLSQAINPFDELERLYNNIDIDGNEYLSRKEFGMFLDSMNINFSQKKWIKIYKEIDRNYDDMISFKEFFLFLYPDSNIELAIEVQRLKIISQDSNNFLNKIIKRRLSTINTYSNTTTTNNNIIRKKSRPTNPWNLKLLKNKGSITNNT